MGPTMASPRRKFCFGWSWCGPCAVAVGVAVAPRAALGDPPRHAAAVEVAAVGSSVRDDLMVPLASSGAGVAIGAGYLGYLGPGILDVGVRLGFAVGSDRVDALGAALEHGIGIRYAIPLRPLGSWHTAVGPAAGVDADFFYLGDWDDSHAYWIGARWVGAAARAWRPLGNRWRMDVAGELGLFGLVSRPPPVRDSKQDPLDSLGYLFVDVHDGGELAWMGNWQLARARVELSRPGGDSFVAAGWRFGGELRLDRTSEPTTAFAVQIKLIGARAWGW